ncbi:hypothetical protein SRHO_G00122520 [Serrasalmus rhombeus]
MGNINPQRTHIGFCKLADQDLQLLQQPIHKCTVLHKWHVTLKLISTVQSLPIRQSKAYIELSSACTMATPAMCGSGKAPLLPSAKVDAA